MAGKCPCRGCTERILLCHGRCERYQKWKQEYEENRTDYRDVPDLPRAIKRYIYRKWKGRR